MKGFDVFERFRVGEFGKGLGEVGTGFQAVGLGRFDETVEIGAGISPALRGGEQREL